MIDCKINKNVGNNGNKCLKIINFVAIQTRKYNLRNEDINHQRTKS